MTCLATASYSRVRSHAAGAQGSPYLRSVQSGEPKASAGDPTHTSREGADFLTTSSSSSVSSTGPKWFVFVVICTEALTHNCLHCALRLMVITWRRPPWHCNTPAGCADVHAQQDRSSQGRFQREVIDKMLSEPPSSK